MPYPGSSWQMETKARPFAHEYIRNGTAKMMTLFHPATGRVRLCGTQTTKNEVLHNWMKNELTQILAELPAVESRLSPEQNRQA